MAVLDITSSLVIKPQLINKRLSQLGFKLKSDKIDPNLKFEISVGFTGTGNAGDEIFASLDLGTFDDQLYYAIISYLTASSTPEASFINVETDRWELLDCGITDHQIPLYVGNQTGTAAAGGYLSGIQGRDMSEMIYIGRPSQIDSDAGILTLGWWTNNNGETYNGLLLLWAFSVPLPLGQIYRPMLY